MRDTVGSGNRFCLCCRILLGSGFKMKDTSNSGMSLVQSCLQQ